MRTAVVTPDELRSGYMVSVGIWNRQGTMDEEFFLWDNQTFYSKMGLT